MNFFGKLGEYFGEILKKTKEWRRKNNVEQGKSYVMFGSIALTKHQNEDEIQSPSPELTLERQKRLQTALRDIKENGDAPSVATPLGRQQKLSLLAQKKKQNQTKLARNQDQSIKRIKQAGVGTVFTPFTSWGGEGGDADAQVEAALQQLDMDMDPLDILKPVGSPHTINNGKNKRVDKKVKQANKAIKEMVSIMEFKGDGENNLSVKKTVPPKTPPRKHRHKIKHHRSRNVSNNERKERKKRAHTKRNSIESILKPSEGFAQRSQFAKDGKMKKNNVNASHGDVPIPTKAFDTIPDDVKSLKSFEY